MIDLRNVKPPTGYDSDALTGLVTDFSKQILLHVVFFAAFFELLGIDGYIAKCFFLD
jgi:hypothetical protein